MKGKTGHGVKKPSDIHTGKTHKVQHTKRPPTKRTYTGR